MTPTEFMTWAGWAATAVCGAAAVYERFRNKQKDEAREVVKVITTERDAWKSMAETKEAEFKAYREQTHTAADAAHTQVVKLTGEVAELRARTDITPLLKHQEEQSQINVKMLTALDEVLAHLRTFKRTPKAKGKLSKS